MKYNVCTWLCVDSKGSESSYSQMESMGSSTSKKFIDTYYKNIVVFFLSCKKFNPNVNLILFTNTKIPDLIGKLNFNSFLNNLAIEIRYVNFTYETPAGYYKAWRNQFFEFNILEDINKHKDKQDDLYLLLDSDCVFTKPLDSLWFAGNKYRCLTFKIDYPKDKIINGLSRIQMKEIYQDLLGIKLANEPIYYGGEFLLATSSKIQLLVTDFKQLWPILLERYAKNQIKFNEEAHVLSFLYFKNKMEDGNANTFISRLWTQPYILRNVVADDANKLIWHLPHEKKYGMLELFKKFSGDFNKYLNLSDESFGKILRYYLTVPTIPVAVYATRIFPVQIAKTILRPFQRK